MIEITVKKVKLSRIRLNPDNPRRIAQKNMDYLIKSIQDFPEMMQLREIVVDETMTVLGGNMRALALRKTGAKECTAKIVKGLTRDQKRKFIVKDNGSFGEWDFDLLANGFDDLPLADFGVDIPKSWGEDPGAGGGGGGEGTPGEAEKPNIIVCPKCHHEFSVLKEKKGAK
jgi:hypothetical protein